MAKYTILFADYLKKGGQLPTLFSSVPLVTVGNNEINFTDMFKTHYAFREIGAETDELFLLYLESVANIQIPFYIDKINTIKKAYSDPQHAKIVKWYKNPILPTGGSVPPNDSLTDMQEDFENGFTNDAYIDNILKIQNNIKNVYEELIKKFNTCFMVVL